ncbi:MAG: 4Fe-4S dicluster domain-containing protein [Oligoflexia bacterium]|nr:4Fe-4S dicluster domain-containing protein [Oligoflexia bacterium]
MTMDYEFYLIYLKIKPILFSLVFLTAVGVFAYRIYFRFLLMKSVGNADQSKFNLDQLMDRIFILFSDVLGQKNVRRKVAAGVAHMGIFLGFLAVAPHTTEMFLKGLIPTLSLDRIVPTFYNWYLFVANIFAVLVLIGVVYGLYRRLIVKPKYLTNTPSAILILLTIAVIIVTYFTINSSHYSGNVFAFEISYWIHVLAVLGFLAYLPGSKHLHIITAAPNVFLKPLKKEKGINKTNLENSEATTFGLSKVSELNWKNVLDLYSCTQCGRCEEQCPAANTSKPLSPKQLINDLKDDLFLQADAILERKNKKRSDVSNITREGQPITDEVLWSCTTCRACENICPVNINHLDVITEARKNLVLMEARFPEEVQSTFQNLENQSNPWGFGQDTRADWCKDLNLRTSSENPESEYLFFAGCFGAFEERGIKIAHTTAKLLKRANVDFAILGVEETCCGDPARRAGNEYLAQMQMNQLVATLKQYKFKKIITVCPHCLNSIKNEYPDFDGHFEIIHHSQFLLELVKSGKLVIDTNANKIDNQDSSVTFHDSCYLTRWNSVIDEPRELLKSIPGINLIEMPRKKDLGFCCGAGGARMFMEDKVGTRINHQRAIEALDTKAKTVVSGCPFCYTMLSDAMKEKGLNMAVKDIVEILEPRSI